MRCCGLLPRRPPRTELPPPPTAPHHLHPLPPMPPSLPRRHLFFFRQRPQRFPSSNPKSNRFSDSGLDRFAAQVHAELSLTRQQVSAQTCAPAAAGEKFAPGSHHNLVRVIVPSTPRPSASQIQKAEEELASVAEARADAETEPEAAQLVVIPGEEEEEESVNDANPVNASSEWEGNGASSESKGNGATSESKGIDASSESRGIDARMERSSWTSTLHRAMLLPATRAAVAVVTTGALAVGKIALTGATMSLAMACGFAQTIRLARDPSSVKVAPLPLPVPHSYTSEISLAGPEASPPSPKPARRIPASPMTDSSPSSPLSIAESPLSSPSKKKKHSKFKFKCPKHAKKESPPLQPSPARALQRLPAARDRPFSALDSPAPSNHQALRMGELSEEKRSELIMPVHREANVVSHVEQKLQQQSSRIRVPLAAVGLLIGLAGLFVGRIVTVAAVVCWWFVIPLIVGEKPIIVRVQQRDLTPKTNQKGEGDSRSVNSTPGKVDIRPDDYRKRVIMEGILDRDRRATG